MNAEELKKQKVNRQHKNKKGDRSLPKINYYVAYVEKIQTVNFRTKVRHLFRLTKRNGQNRNCQIDKGQSIDCI